MYKKHVQKSSRRVKIPTPVHLANVALTYLSRYAASEASLRRVLDNRLRRAILQDPVFAHDHEKQDQLRTAIETIIEGHVKTGALNDTAYAEIKARGLRRAGRSRRAIHRALGVKGVDGAAIAHALMQTDSESDPETAEVKAAIKLARRRRLGPYRSGTTDATRHMKDMAAMARAGFSLNTIRKVLGSEAVEEELF